MQTHAISSGIATDQLSLSSQYQAAWGEHSVRIAQRQSVLQFYLATVGVIYTLWFTHLGKVDGAYVSLAITVITLASSCLMAIHNRVIHELTDFMKRCEQHSAPSIQRANGSPALFYFYDGHCDVNKFHLVQRWYQRIVLACVLLGSNGFAIYATWDLRPSISVASLLLCAVAFGVMFMDLKKN